MIPSDKELTELLQTARRAARKAADIHRSRYGEPGHVSFKQGIELVTEVDVESEQAATRVIRERFPDHAILAEESGTTGRASPHTWIIDPLDGTVNFAHGFPVFAASVAYALEDRVLVGACHNALWQEEYWAHRGGGAYLNGQQIQVSGEDDLARAMLATGFSYDIRSQPETNLDHFAHLSLEALAIRRAGAAVVDLSCVAAGRFDGFWEFRLKPWDTAAAALLVEEAGGRVTRLDGGPWDPHHPVIVASNGRIHDALLAALNRKPHARTS